MIEKILCVGEERFIVPMIGDTWNTWFILWDKEFTLRLEERSYRTLRSDGTFWVYFVESTCRESHLCSEEYRLEGLCAFVRPGSTFIFLAPADPSGSLRPSPALGYLSDEQIGMIVTVCAKYGIDYIFWSRE